jgi:uncharacterized membrane protein YeaQ/YmgE (transglycosylase-associated protein family)
MIAGFISWMLVGLVVGWLAGKAMKSGGSAPITDIVVGMIGAVIGGWVFGRMGGFPFGGLIGTIVTALAGSVIFLLLLWLVRMIKKP